MIKVEVINVVATDGDLERYIRRKMEMRWELAVLAREDARVVEKVVEGIVGRTTRGEEKGGLFLVNRTCDTVMNEIELAKLRGSAAEKVETKVREILGPYVG